jgi:hypothetical protein
LEGTINLDCMVILRPPILLSLASSLISIMLLLTLLLSLSFLQLETGLLSAMVRWLPSRTGSPLLFSHGMITLHRGSSRLLLWWWLLPAGGTDTEWSVQGLAWLADSDFALQQVACYYATHGASGSIVVRHCATSWKVTGSRPNEVSFSIYLILPATLGPGVYSASNRNEYQKQRNNVSGEQSAADA